METSTAVAFIIAVIAFILYYFKSKELKNLYSIVQSLKQEKQSQEAFSKKEIEAVQAKLTDSYLATSSLARRQFEEFRDNELDSLRSILAKSARESALAELENWKIQYENFY